MTFAARSDSSGRTGAPPARPQAWSDNVPRVPHAYLPRVRLWSRLEAATQGPVTVLVAPAGAGKSLGVAGWIRSIPDAMGHSECRAAVLWANADSSWDGRRLQALLDGAAADAAVVRAPVLPGEPDVSHSFIVIDDAHKLSRSALTVIDERLRADPGSLHLLLLSQWDLFIGGLGSVMLGDLTVLRGEYLRIDDHEADTLIRHHARTSDPEVLRSIRALSSGWLGVLVLAARAVGAAPDPRAAALGYLAEESHLADRIITDVFSALSQRERHLLLCLGGEELVSAELAADLSQDSSAGEVLNRLESTGLLVSRIRAGVNDPGSEIRYRIHPLLSEVVRRRLTAGGVDVEQAKASVRRATHRDIAGGDFPTAFRRLLTVHAYSEAAELLATEGYTILSRGQSAKIADFVQHHSEETLRVPSAWFAVVIERWFAGDLDGARLWLDRLISKYGSDRAFAIEVACGRLMRARLGFEPIHAAVGHAQRLLLAHREATADPAHAVNSAALTILCMELGITQNWLGDLVQAEANLTVAIGLCRSRNLPLLEAGALSHLALTHYMAGREHAARSVAQESSDKVARSQLHQRHFTFGRIDLVQSLCQLVDVPWVSPVKAPNPADLHPADLAGHFWLHLLTARRSLNNRDVQGAIRHLDTSLNLPVTPDLPDPLRVARMIDRALTAALSSDARLLHEVHAELAASKFVGESALVTGLLADLQGDRARAATAFATASGDMSFAQLASRELALVCEAQLLDAMGKHDRALRCLGLAVTDTAVRRNAVPFLGWSRQGTPVHALLTRLADTTPTRWLAELIDATNHQSEIVNLFANVTATPGEQAHTSAGLLIPTLSSREREVLRELARGSTYADISTNLFISENTVKTHVSSLYSKLNANRRSEALAIARTMHLM